MLCGMTGYSLNTDFFMFFFLNLFNTGLLLRSTGIRRVGCCFLLKFLQAALKTVLQCHVVVRTETQASPHHVCDGLSLREQSIYHGRTVWNEGSLQHVGQQGKHRMELLPFLRAFLLYGNSLAEFTQNHQVVNQRRCQEGVFAGIVHCNGIPPPHEDFRCVLIHGTLRVTDVWDVFDNNNVVGMFVFFEQYAIRFHHVVHDVRLGDFFASELRRRAQVFSIVVSQVVVRYNRYGFDSGTDQKIDEDALHLCLSALEIVSGNENLLLAGEFHDTGNKGVLGRSVDKGGSLQNRCNRENSGRADLGLVALDGMQNVFCGVVDSLLDASESLGVGSPQHDNLVEIVIFFEVGDVLSDVFHLFLFCPGQDIVGTLALVGGDEIWEVNTRQGNDVLHVRIELLLEVVIQDL
mmetsp:Transcript_1158/g.2618  ORF Transcript_1158/g.2618 Transcript_1158/m.2618 type:complete len:406 (+) Transcript_1158:1792-3009(+)